MENARHPLPGIDYPRTFQEMDNWFRTEAGGRDYVRRLRWPQGFVCRRCGAIGEPWVTARGVFHCRACAGETSLTAGTIFEGTRKPLRMWFDVVRHQPEERRQCLGLAAGAWAG